MAHPLQALAGFLANRQRQMDVDYLQRGREDRARKERDTQRELEAARHKERRRQSGRGSFAFAR
jgi:hypothetical protein